MFSIMLVHLCQPLQGTKLLVNKWCRGEGTEDAGRRQVLFSSTTFIHYNHLNSCKDLLEVKSSTSNSAGKKPSLSVNTRCNYSHLKGGFQRWHPSAVHPCNLSERSPWPHSMTSPLSTQIHTSLPSSFPQAYHESILRCTSTHSPGNFDCLTPSPHRTPLSHLKSFSKVSIEPSLQRGFTDH